MSAVDPVAAVDAAYERIGRAGRPDVWTLLLPLAEARAAAARVDPQLSLAGKTLAVKDNIDVFGMATTAGCPAFAYQPVASAPAVLRLQAAGAVVLGKTNLDQFATGLVGTRSPFGVVANAVDDRYVAGGSSSGSAVAVALGLVDLALGTDTAGSGRVPAAFNGVVGLKPTPGLVSIRGVVPACRSFDCVSVFAGTVDLAWRALALLVEFDAEDPYSCAEAPGWRRVDLVGPEFRIGVPSRGLLADLADPSVLAAFDDAVDRWRGLGATICPVDLGGLFQAGNLLYGGAFAAERAHAVGEFIRAHPEDVDPVVAGIILAAGSLSAVQLAGDHERLRTLQRATADLWGEVDALLVPTADHHPTLAEVAADPVGVNSRLGRFMTFCNPLRFAAAAVPAGRTSEGLPFGVTLYGPAQSDARLAALAALFLGEHGASGDQPAPSWAAPVTIPIAVVGAHLSGQPLNGQLRERGGRLIRRTTTAARYELFALTTDPPKPGLVRVGEGSDQGRAIEVEVWDLAADAFGDFVAQVPPPLAIGRLELADGSAVAGFVCTPDGLVGARDITHYGAWRAYLADR